MMNNEANLKVLVKNGFMSVTFMPRVFGVIVNNC